MSSYALMTVDLHGTEPARRASFEDALRGRKWRKLGPAGAWWASFKDEITRDEAIETAKRDVAASAQVAGITIYAGAVQVGSQLQTSF